MDFRKDIQGLRGLAFLLVFIFHLNSAWLPGGFIGVDVFFVISGFLITSIILHQKSKNTFSFLNFYKKRIQRIVPAQYVMVLIVALLGFQYYLYSDIADLSKGLISSLLFFSNTFFANGPSYFGAAATENPLLHTWTLSIEMQFYFLLPLLLIFVKKKYLKPLILIGLILISLIASYFLIYEQKTHLYFSLIARIPEFLIGAFFSIAFNGKTLNRQLSVFLSSVGFILILGAAFLLKSTDPFPGVTALVPCLGAALLLISSETFFTRLLTNKLAVYIGELSYSLYLWHWPVMAFLRYNNDRYLFTRNEIVVVTFFTLFLAFLSYKLIENKFRYLSDRKFLTVFIPLTLFAFIFSVFLPRTIANKELPKFYSAPYFGLVSHNTGEVERLGNLKSNDKILLIGDSHTLVLKLFFDTLGKQLDFGFSTLSADSYPPLEGLKVDEIIDDTNNPNQLENFNRAKSISKVAKSFINESDVIIINSVNFDRIPSLKNAVISMADNLNPDQIMIIIKTFPKLDRNPIRLNKGFRKNGHFSYQIIDVEMPDELGELAETNRQVFIYDVSKSKIFSNDQMPFFDDLVMYYDKDHLNNYGAVCLAKDLKSDFTTFWNEVYTKF